MYICKLSNLNVWCEGRLKENNTQLFWRQTSFSVITQILSIKAYEEKKNNSIKSLPPGRIELGTLGLSDPLCYTLMSSWLTLNLRDFLWMWEAGHEICCLNWKWEVLVSISTKGFASRYYFLTKLTWQVLTEGYLTSVLFEYQLTFELR